jgi:hypothetical protein
MNLAQSIHHQAAIDILQEVTPQPTHEESASTPISPTFTPTLPPYIKLQIESIMIKLQSLQLDSTEIELQIIVKKLTMYSDAYFQHADFNAYKESCNQTFETHQEDFQRALNPASYTLFQRICHTFYRLFEFITAFFESLMTQKNYPSTHGLFAEKPPVSALAKELLVFKESINVIEEPITEIPHFSFNKSN